MIEPDTVFDVYAISQTYNLPRLEEAATAHFALHIDDVVRLPQVSFKNFI